MVTTLSSLAAPDLVTQVGLRLHGLYGLYGPGCPLSPAWWRHQMETFSALLALCAGNSPVPVNSPHKGQWRRALTFSLISVRINDWANNREACDLRRHRGHYDVSVMERPLNIITQSLTTGGTADIRYATCSGKYVLIKPSGNLMPIFFCCSKLNCHYTSPNITPLDRPGHITPSSIISYDIYHRLTSAINVMGCVKFYFGS